MSTNPLINIATKAARQGGRLAMQFFHNVHQLEVRTKLGSDLVTNADIAVEREILSCLRRAYPEYGVLAEESGGARIGTQGRIWVVDPIDGTNNFAHGIPHFAISIALLQDGEPVIGVVHNPVLDEIFCAERGGGAFLDNRRMRVSSLESMSQALLATGFPFRNKERLDGYLTSFRALFHSCQSVRRAGSAALDMAYVASGRLDGFWEPNLSPWDIAAGILLVQESGGFVTDFHGGNSCLRSGNVLCGSPMVHRRMLELLAETPLATW
ncbi:MAG: inositol monophosphatase [Magnetococcales bacterium]|nr:inositol monophosphatase [Magnetococcales bacterium]